MDPTRKPWYRPRNIALGFLALVLVLTCWAGYWVYWALTVEPNPSTDYAAQLEQLSRDAQPPGENGWPDIMRACTIFERLDEAFPAHERVPHHQGGFEFEAIYRADYEPRPFDPYDLEGITDDDVRQEKLDALAWLDEQGAWDAVASAGAKAHFVGPIDARGGMLFSILLPEISTMRQLAKARAATMALAIQTGENDEAVSSLEDLITLSRASSAQAILISGLVGDAIRQMSYHLIHQELMLGHLDAALMAQFLNVLNDNPAPADIALQLRGERIFFDDVVQWLYSDDGDGDGSLILTRADLLDGTMGPLAPQQGASQTLVRLRNLAGLFMASRKEVGAKADEIYFQFITLATAKSGPQRWDRVNTITGQVHNLGYQYMPLGLLVTAIGKSVMTHDMLLMEYDATRLMLAIELHRAAYGSPPESLDALIPEFLVELPTDRATNKPFGYRLLEGDEHGRDYLLYSFGRDTKDNGGIEMPGAKPYEVLRSKDSKGFDFVINTPVVMPADN